MHGVPILGYQNLMRPVLETLADGRVRAMFDHGTGVQPVKIATINRINEDFFEELYQMTAGPRLPPSRGRMPALGPVVD